jgi:cell division transport system permease protein
MPLPAHVFAPAFRHRRLGWLFALLVAMMVYLASFATAAEATLSALTFTWDKDMESRLTVEIPPADAQSAIPQSERVQKVVTALEGLPGVDSVTVVPDEETVRLLRPWIAQPELIQALPIPTLVDVTRTSDSHLTADAVQDRLKTLVGGVHVDDHAAWLGDLGNLVHGLSAIAGLIVLLTMLTLIITVSLLCRAVMATEHEAIALLHVMGAEDDDIALHFQFHARRMALPAAIAGFVFALLSLGLMFFFIRHLVDLSALHILHWLGLACAVIAVPLVAVLIAAYTARLSVLRLLHGMP